MQRCFITHDKFPATIDLGESNLVAMSQIFFFQPIFFENAIVRLLLRNFCVVEGEYFVVFELGILEHFSE